MISDKSNRPMMIMMIICCQSPTNSLLDSPACYLIGIAQTKLEIKTRNKYGIMTWFLLTPRVQLIRIAVRFCFVLYALFLHHLLHSSHTVALSVSSLFAVSLLRECAHNVAISKSTYGTNCYSSILPH